MLQHLSIKNYILIEELEMDFFEGLSMITGETGAGKSILFGAISLILGQRADTQSLLYKDKKCVVEGSFYIRDYHLTDFFNTNQLDYDDLCILRREINQQGRSRAFINDTPVTVEVLKMLGDQLIDIHSQHKTLMLNKPDFQLSLIDNFALKSNELSEYKLQFTEYQSLVGELTALIEKDKKAKSDQDYYQFLFDELENARLKPGEQSELELELGLLNNAEEIKTALFSAIHGLGNGEINIIENLTSILSSLKKVSDFHPGISECVGRIQSLSIELADIHSDIEKLDEEIQFSPERITFVNERLDQLYVLEHKHHVTSVEELIDIQENLSEKLQFISSLDEQINELNLLVDKSYQNLDKIASDISSKRVNCFNQFEKEILELLTELAMPDAVFKVNHRKLEHFNKNGVDQIVFLFNANKGGEPVEISKAASGGELSRLMLSVKSLITRQKLLPTIIFDEIDTGVSGKIAGKVGEILNGMSEKMQVIVITHIAQIAGKGQNHYKVIKLSEADATRTTIQLLSYTERVAEIAEMLSGEGITDAVTETARQLLGRN